MNRCCFCFFVYGQSLAVFVLLFPHSPMMGRTKEMINAFVVPFDHFVLIYVSFLDDSRKMGQFESKI